MKLTSGEVFIAKETLDRLMEFKIPVKTSFAIAKLANKVSAEYAPIAVARNKLIQDYGKEDPKNPGIISVDRKIAGEEGFNKWVEGLVELMNEEVELDIDKIIPIKLPETIAATCDKCNHNMDKPLEIEPSILMALEKFIEV